ncbi:MAG: hypothetical protein AB8B64_18830 [Granulosicoccus sp.]
MIDLSRQRRPLEFSDPIQCQLFRDELRALQITLTVYTGMLGEIAGVEDDLRDLEWGSPMT